MQYLNVNTTIMILTADFGGSEVFFYDPKVMIDKNEIITFGYRKDTASNVLLHYNSNHPSHVKKSYS